MDGDERNECIHEINEEIVGNPDLCMASHFSFGTRSGYWRVSKVLSDFGIAIFIVSPKTNPNSLAKE